MSSFNGKIFEALYWSTFFQLIFMRFDTIQTGRIGGQKNPFHCHIAFRGFNFIEEALTGSMVDFMSTLLEG